MKITARMLLDDHLIKKTPLNIKYLEAIHKFGGSYEKAGKFLGLSKYKLGSTVYNLRGRYKALHGIKSKLPPSKVVDLNTINPGVSKHVSGRFKRDYQYWVNELRQNCWDKDDYVLEALSNFYLQCLNNPAILDQTDDLIYKDIVTSLHAIYHDFRGANYKFARNTYEYDIHDLIPFVDNNFDSESEDDVNCYNKLSPDPSSDYIDLDKSRADFDKIRNSARLLRSDNTETVKEIATEYCKHALSKSDPVLRPVVCHHTNTIDKISHQRRLDKIKDRLNKYPNHQLNYSDLTFLRRYEYVV